MMKPYATFIIPVLGLLISGCSAPEAAAVEQPENGDGLTPEDVIEIKSVGSTAMSPDGERVAYTLTAPRSEDDDIGPAYSELHIYDAGSEESIAVIETPQSAASPVWINDGENLAFSAVLPEHDDNQQVYAVDRDAENLEQLTEGQYGVGNFTFTSDYSYIAYLGEQPLPDEVKDRIDRGYDMEATGENEQFDQVFVEETGGSEPREITPDDKQAWDLAWSPDGDRLVVRLSESDGPDQEMMFSKFYTVNADGSDLEELSETEGRLADVEWSPNGDYIAFLGAKMYSDPLPQRIYVVDADGGDAKDITPDDYEGTPEWLSWHGSETLHFVSVEKQHTALNQINRDGENFEHLVGGDYEIFRAVSFNEDRSAFSAAVNTQSHPGELYTATVDGDFERHTHHNTWLDDVALGEQKVVSWKGADDVGMEGVLTLPVGYEEGERYPLAVLPHGGPEGISIDGWNTRPLYPAQVLANEGYVVFKPNYRGSGGRGTWFATANHRDLGGKEFIDVIKGIDYLDEEGKIDPDRVGMSGTSYGGYFSAWAGTRYSDRFAATITFAGLSNWVSFTGTTDIPFEMSDVHWDQHFFDNPGQYEDRSPVYWLKESDTPILVATGLADTRVHPEQSLQLYTLLDMLGKETQLVEYPRQPHGLNERAHQHDFMERVIDWFGTHME